MLAEEGYVALACGTLLVIETSSRPSYVPARSLYQSLGYTQVGQIPNFYRLDDDCLLYAKPLV